MAEAMPSADVSDTPETIFPAAYSLETPVKSRAPRWLARLTMCGPGIVVMLADSNAGSVITGAQSSAEWGYQLLSARSSDADLYIAQELTVRLESPNAVTAN